MKLTCYELGYPTELVPGSPQRDWMDAHPTRQPYRCLPLVVANTSGWELRAPFDFIARWNGGDAIDDLRIDADCDEQPLPSVSSHFGAGVLTFHSGYLFRTDPGWDLWVGGAPNVVKDGIAPLTGIVETAWLAMPFTMNWRFTRPGLISFRRGEPYCFVMPIPHSAIDDVDPIVRPISDDAELEAEYRAWSESRLAFNRGLAEGDPAAIEQGWQRHYFEGRRPGSDSPEAADHLTRRRLPAPRPPRPGE